MLAVISEEACTRSCAALALELQGAAEWSRADVEKSNVLPMRKQAPVVSPLITPGNLLRHNTIKVSRQRPVSPWVNESQFRAARFS